MQFLKAINARFPLILQQQILSNVQALALYLQQTKYKADPRARFLSSLATRIGGKVTIKPSPLLSHVGFQKTASNCSQS